METRLATKLRLNIYNIGGSYMKKKVLFLVFMLFIICSLNLLAVNVPEKASKIEDFIPKGWKELIVKKGDLNKDRIDDVVLLIQKDNPENIMDMNLEYPPFFENNVNFNPIIILVLFKDKNSQYNLVAKNEKDFILSEGKAIEEQLESLKYISDNDFNKDFSKSISIKNNTLRIFTYVYHHKMSSSSEYVFRYQNNRFELIGLERIYESVEDNYQYINKYSINFSTKKSQTTSITIKGDEKPNEITEINDIKIKEKYFLDTMTQKNLKNIISKYTR